MVRRRFLIAASLCSLAGCAATPQVILPDPPDVRRTSLTTLLAANPLAEGENIRAVVLSRTDALSYHLVQIRDREQPHIHATHDLAVTLVRGTGTLYIRGVGYAMRVGDVAVVPRGTVHYFVNDASGAAVALVTFAPPYDGKDQVPTTP